MIPEVVAAAAFAAAEGCLLATSKQLPNNNSSQNSNRTIEHCWTVAELCLRCVFFLSLLFFWPRTFLPQLDSAVGCRAQCGSHGTEFGSRLVSVASALRVEAQRSGPTLAELCVALCAAVGCCVCRLLFGCLVVWLSWLHGLHMFATIV